MSWESHAMRTTIKPVALPYSKPFNFTPLRYLEHQACSATSAGNIWDLRAKILQDMGTKRWFWRNSNIIGVDVWYIFQVLCFFEFANMPSMNCWDAFRASLDVMSWPFFFVCLCSLFTNLRALASPSCSSNSSTSRTCALMQFEK